jgi:hypothetical protein
MSYYTLEELYDFANVSAIGGNHYTVELSDKVWNTEKGRKLSSFCDPDSFYQHFIMVHLYGAMAQRYSGVFDTRESYILHANENIKMFYEHLSNSTYPFGYRFYTIEKENGIQLIFQKENEPLQNMNARIGIEFYNDIPDAVHRPPYYTKTNIVTDYLSCSMSEYELKMKNKLRNEKSLQQLKLYQLEIEQSNIQRFLNSIQNFDRKKLISIIDSINYESDEPIRIPKGSTNKDLLNIIEEELMMNSYTWSMKIIKSL